MIIQYSNKHSPDKSDNYPLLGTELPTEEEAVYKVNDNVDFIVLHSNDKVIFCSYGCSLNLIMPPYNKEGYSSDPGDRRFKPLKSGDITTFTQT